MNTATQMTNGDEQREAVEADRAADQALGAVVLHVVPEQDGEACAAMPATTAVTTA